METLLQDVKYGLRVLARSPGYVALAAAALALGIGVNTAIFSVADAFLFEAVSFPQLGRLVMLFQTLPREQSARANVSPGDYEDWKRQQRSFAQLAAWQWGQVDLSGNGIPEQAYGFRVTSNFFGELGVAPAMGRAFLPEETVPGKNQVAVLSHQLWVRRYGGDPSILGKTIRVDGRSLAVVGVMPMDFDYPVPADLWLPLAMTDQEKADRNRHSLHVVGAIAPGVTLDQARAELGLIQQRLVDRYPNTDKGWGTRAEWMRTHISSDLTRQYVILLVVAVGFVLLIACANVANLQFARATRRQRELAVRTAMGASRWRLTRQLLTESILVSVVGAAAGLLLAQWSIHLILSHMPASVAREIAGWYKIRLDTRAFLFALAAAVAAGVLAGLAPALESSNPDLNETLKEGGRGGSAGRARRRWRSVFVVAEIALSLILLIGAGLLVKGFRALTGLNDQFEPDSLLTLRVDLPHYRYGDIRARALFYQQALRGLAALPGAQAVALATNVPYGDDAEWGGFAIEGRPTRPDEHPGAYWEIVNPDFLGILHVPLLQGRPLTDQDGPGAAPVALVSETMVRKYFRGENPLGRRIKLNTVSSPAPWATIVGVVADVKYDWTVKEPQPAIYQPVAQSAEDGAYLMLRASGDPASLAGAVQERIASVDPDLPVTDVLTMAQVISQSVIGIGYVAVMMAVLGLVALVLACVGVYGVMAFAVGERTHEIGIRMALGAERNQVLRLVVAQGFWLTAIAVAIALPASLGLARLLAGLLFGVNATDAPTFIGISALLMLVALAACYIPARRAMQVDPVVALRHE
ncbi:MAG TPA: ABC transporter permease [Candidatus Acidoferrales bacterium]|nr:ABC transporter permease [Candidatus Acidoferrales bacterium]